MTQDTNIDDIDYSFLKGGLLHRLLVKLGISQFGPAEIRARVLFVIGITYVPLVLLACIQGVAWNPAIKEPFLFDITEACRFLLVAPLLVIAEAVVEPWLVQVVRHIRARLIDEDERPRFDHLIERANRWRDSTLAEVFFLLITFGAHAVEGLVIPAASVTTWHTLPGTDDMTYAFLWCMYFSKPVVRFLWLRWLWRYLIWIALLARVARLRLKVTPTHPDLSGGLSFIVVGHARFCVLAFAFGIQTASLLAEQILFEGRTLPSYQYALVGLIGFVLAIFLVPLLVFSGPLLAAKRIGLFEYDTLANRYITSFHDKWIAGKTEEELLGNNDVQSMADLNSCYQIVRQMKMSLIGKEVAIIFAVAVILPLTPLILTVYPFDVIVKDLIKAVM